MAMDSISNSGVSLILNPEIAHAINDHHHDLSTCEEEFENQEEIQQMLVDAFDSQSLSNSDHDEQRFDDEIDDVNTNEKKSVENSLCEPRLKPDDEQILRDENENLRRQLVDSLNNEEIYRKRCLDYERTISELNEKFEQKQFSIRLEYESKHETSLRQLSEQQIEILTLKQKYESVVEEKNHRDEQIEELRNVERMIGEKFEKLQIDYNEVLKLMKEKSKRENASTQTTKSQEIDEETRRKLNELHHENAEVKEQLKQVQNRLNEREQIFSIERNQFEKHLKELTKPTNKNSVKTQTELVEEEENKKVKQLQNEIEDYKLKLSSKQIELNTIKFDFDHLKQEMNDRLSLLNANVSTEEMNKVLAERDLYFNELSKLKSEIPDLKQQLIESFQNKVASFKEQVKKSLADKDNEYRKRIEQMENEYISQYEQVLEKNKQVVRSLLAAKQDEFDTEKEKIIQDYEEKLVNSQKKSQLTNEEKSQFEQKIEELTRLNEKLNNHILKQEQDRRQREKLSLNVQKFDETKRKHSEEIHRLYEQIAKQNQQQIVLIDEHQKQIEQLKNTYDQRYRVLLDEWKVYNNDLHESNSKLKCKLKDYEKTIVQLRYHIINLQIEYLQNGGNAKNIIPISHEMK